MLRLYQQPDPTGGTTPSTPTTPTTPITPDPGGKPGAQPGAAGKTFTQDELNAIIAERLKREKEQFKDYEDLKKFKEESESKNKSELEKERDRATKAEAEAKKIREESAQRLLTSEARAVAAELGFSKPDRAVRLADLADAVKDGEVDSAKVKAALEALAKDMPELLGKVAPHVDPTNPTKGNAPGGKETDEQKRARLRGGGAVNDWLQSGSVIVNQKQ
jgi:hypothetical protein